ncbi:MAG: hypothetical protein ACFFAO_19675 [Candidatus Hermodarchaeota archaeon]
MKTLIKIYHGTTKRAARQMVNNMGPPHNIDVSLGGGELGRGFYAGDSPSLAIAWAKGKGSNHMVIKIKINLAEYIRLKIKNLDFKAVRSVYNAIKFTNAERSYMFNVDVVTGPLVSYSHVTQYKFESKIAESRLNNWNMEVL